MKNSLKFNGLAILLLIFIQCTAQNSPEINIANKLYPYNFIHHLEYKSIVLSEPNYHLWCSSPIFDKHKRVHLFVSRWKTEYRFHPGWATECEIAQYIADKPEGPFKYYRTILKGDPQNATWMRFAPHNPTIVKVGKRYALLFIANNGYKKGFPANQKIGMAIANDLFAEFKLINKDGLLLSTPTDSTIWSFNSKVGVNNPTLLQHPDGRFLLYYKAMVKNKPRQMGVAVSKKLEGPYQFTKNALTNNKGTIEDGFAFMLKDTVCLLCTDCYGDFDLGGGQLWTSTNGLDFSQKPYPAYHNLGYYTKVEKSKVTNYWMFNALQRPSILLNNKSQPTYLYTPCGTNIDAGKGSVVYLFKIR